MPRCTKSLVLHHSIFQGTEIHSYVLTFSTIDKGSIIGFHVKNWNISNKGSR